MGIRIDAIERREFEGHYAWHVRIKGFEGRGEYCRISTGVDGHGLFVSSFMLDRRVLLPPERFYVHPGCTGEQVAHRIASVLTAIGWGHEHYDDWDSITDGSPVHAAVRQTPNELMFGD